MEGNRMKLETIFSNAQNWKKNNVDFMYRVYKEKIQKLNLPPEQYEEAIKKLCDILEY
jgi:hypothetical protein